MLPNRVMRRCDDLLGGPTYDANARAVAWNLKHEHRVSDERGIHWADLMAGPLSDSLKTALNVYGDSVAARPFETYRHRVLNRNNILHPSDADLPGPGDTLVHVLDLTGPRSIAIWRDLKDQDSAGLLGDWDSNGVDSLRPVLDKLLARRSIEEQLPLMRAFFSAYRGYLEKREPHGPIWAALWSKWFDRVNRMRAESWASATGLCKLTPPNFLAILKYPADLGNPLIRPTQLEAGYFGRHFPSPPCASAGHGGRIVQGRSGNMNTNPTKALREFIHPPIQWTEHEWVASGLPVIETAFAVGAAGELASDRSGHWSDLCHEFGQAPVSTWMDPANG